MSKRPDIAVSLDRLEVTDVQKVRARTHFVPGFTEDTDPTHLTTGFLKYNALCGHYPVEICGDSPSGKWCLECITEAERRIDTND